MVQAGRGVNEAQHRMQIQRPAGRRARPQRQGAFFLFCVSAPGRQQAHGPQRQKPNPARNKAQRRQHFAPGRHMVAGKLRAIQGKAQRRPQPKGRAHGAKRRAKRRLRARHIGLCHFLLWHSQRQGQRRQRAQPHGRIAPCGAARAKAGGHIGKQKQVCRAPQCHSGAKGKRPFCCAAHARCSSGRYSCPWPRYL